MPDQKLAALIETIQSETMVPAIKPFLPDPDAPFRLSSTHVEPPEYLWAVFRQEAQRITFKCLLYEEQYKAYVALMQRSYPDRIDRPDHPAGGITFLPAINGVLWGFPFAPSMPGLPDCANGAWVADVLKEPRPLLPHTVSYQPEIGAMFTYRDE